MPYEIKMPQLGMNQDSATIVTWLKNEGDGVNKGDPVFEVETDKATMEVEAQASGYLSAIQVELGVEVPVGNLIATIVENKKDVLKSIEEPNSDNKNLVLVSVNEAFSLIDKAVKKNVLHKNNGANKKSKINKVVKDFLTSK